MQRNNVSILLLGLSLVCSGSTAAEPAVYSWEKHSTAVELKNNDHVVWRFNYGTEKDKVFFHPLALTDGTELTDESHGNHHWHHALWFTWKYINGVNFWEEKNEARRSDGEILWSDVAIVTYPDFHAELSMNLFYNLPGAAEPILRETRTMTVSAPDEDGTYTIDWESVFAACSTEDVVLDRTPLEGQENGKPYGGYAGLSVRFKGAASQALVHTENGQVTDWEGERSRSYRGKAWSMDYSAQVEGRTGGIAIFENVENLNAPTTWYAIEGNMKYFSPAVICEGPHTLRAGETMTLKYRVSVHTGRWDADVLRDKIEECKDL